MNIVISAEHNQLFRQLYVIADSATLGRHLRDMELYAFRGLAPEELLGRTADSSGQLWLMFFNSDNRSDWADVLDRLIIYSNQIVICVASSDYSTVARLVNGHSVRGTAGYIHSVHDSLERSCLNILACLNRCVNSAGGSLTVYGSKQEAQLPLSSIYYIEAIKETHTCNICCSDGIYAFRFGTKELSKKLRLPFR